MSTHYPIKAFLKSESLNFINFFSASATVIVYFSLFSISVGNYLDLFSNVRLLKFLKIIPFGYDVLSFLCIVEFILITFGLGFLYLCL